MSGGDHLMCSPVLLGKSIHEADIDEMEAIEGEVQGHVLHSKGG